MIAARGDRRTRYRMVADTLLEAIRRGEYPVGSSLPTESELGTQFDVSRHTVREALRSLSREGIIASQHGVGSQVVSDHPPAYYVQTLASVSDLWRYVQDTYRTRLRVVDVTTAEAAPALPGGPDRRWRMLEGLRHVNGSEAPIAWTQVFLSPEYGGVLDEADARWPIYALVEKRHGVLAHAVRQTITAVAIDGAVADHLAVAEGSLGLAIQRDYLDRAGTVYEVTWSVHPVDRYQYSMEIVLSSGRA